MWYILRVITLLDYAQKSSQTQRVLLLYGLIIDVVNALKRPGASGWGSSYTFIVEAKLALWETVYLISIMARAFDWIIRATSHTSQEP